jgi:predicted transcriptional regulator
MIQSLPDEVTLDDIMAELYFKLQVDAGLKELDEGKGIPHEEVEKRMSKWLSR